VQPTTDTLQSDKQPLPITNMVAGSGCLGFEFVL
jgi:hypothetical protein